MASKQRRDERKKAKRVEKRRNELRATPTGVAERMRAAAKAPVLDCALHDGGLGQGMSQLLLSRQLRNGEVAFALLLIDSFCLGLKDGFGRVASLGEYRSMKRDLDAKYPPQKIDPASAARFVQDAIEFARRYGFEPHPDARKALPLFADLDPSLAERTFEFGREGKPYYIAGPHDSTDRQRRILETLQRTAGEGGFHSVLRMIPDLGLSESDDLREYDDEDDDLEVDDFEEDARDEVEAEAAIEGESGTDLPTANEPPAHRLVWYPRNK